MNPVTVAESEIKPFAETWLSHSSLPNKGDYSATRFGKVFDNAVGRSLATFLGDIPILTPNRNHLLPAEPNVVEVGAFRVVGGVRSQNFDVGYRPDGVRFAYDTKTLNNLDSVKKNYQNMINDLATEATTVHTRFPYAVVAFLVAVPRPALATLQQSGLIQTLERMTHRSSPQDQPHLAEAISLVIWDPTTATIDPHISEPHTTLRLENLSSLIETSYTDRYKGLPPHHS